MYVCTIYVVVINACMCMYRWWVIYVCMYACTYDADLGHGDFLYEYFGELISTKELNHRMLSYVKKKHLYVMQVRF